MNVTETRIQIRGTDILRKKVPRGVDVFTQESKQLAADPLNPRKQIHHFGRCREHLWLGPE